MSAVEKAEAGGMRLRWCVERPLKKHVLVGA